MFGIYFGMDEEPKNYREITYSFNSDRFTDFQRRRLERGCTLPTTLEARRNVASHQSTR